MRGAPERRAGGGGGAVEAFSMALGSGGGFESAIRGTLLVEVGMLPTTCSVATSDWPIPPEYYRWRRRFWTDNLPVQSSICVEGLGRHFVAGRVEVTPA